MNIDRLKAIIFDFGGTLDYDGKDWSLRLWEQLQKGGLKINKNDFNIATKKAMDMLFDNKESSSLNYLSTIDIYIYWTIKYLELIIEDYKKVLVEPFFNESKEFLEKNKKILEVLSDKYTLVVLSNNFGNCKGWCKEFDLSQFFNVIIDSQIVGYKKPDKKIFESAIEKIGYSFEECAYIGDKYKTDIVPTVELGMFPIWINNANTLQLKDSKVIEIKSLIDLKKIFNLKEMPKLLN